MSECNLTKRIRLADGITRFCAVVLSNNGCIKPDWVIVDGCEERHPEGSYYLDWYEGNKRIRLSVGKNAQAAVARRLTKEAELNALKHGVAVVSEQDQMQARRARTCSRPRQRASLALGCNHRIPRGR